MAMSPAFSDTRAPARWQDYVQLLKPRVMSLVVFTAFTGLICAHEPVHPLLAAVAILCIAVGAGASGALNMWYDADIDAQTRDGSVRSTHPALKTDGDDEERRERRREVRTRMGEGGRVLKIRTGDGSIRFES